MHCFHDRQIPFCTKHIFWISFFLTPSFFSLTKFANHIQP
jgi:hypothetical protein